MLKFGLLVALAVFLVDQAVKAIMLYGANFISCAPCRDFVETCVVCPPVEVTGFFNLVMVWNYGVSYGLFPADGLAERLILIGFSLVIAGGLVVWLTRTQDRLMAGALGLVIGGALGNVIDRVFYGAVADFFDFHLFGYHWYVFNVADVGIVVGVLLLLWDAVMAPPGAGASGQDQRNGN